MLFKDLKLGDKFIIMTDSRKKTRHLLLKINRADSIICAMRLQDCRYLEVKDEERVIKIV